MEVDSSSEKLKILEESLGTPVKLSEKEKERFDKLFEGLKEWLDDTRDVIKEKNRDEAYRYLRLLLSGLQKVDLDYIAGAKAPGGKETDALEELSRIEEAPEPVVKPVVRPTKEQVDDWLARMRPEALEKAKTLLDCIKQYLDPESEVGVDVICNFCSPEKMERCIRDEDPSITDAGTIFMDFQQREP